MTQVDTPGEKPVIDIAIRRLMEGTPKIELTAAFPSEGPFEVQLPIWRPGRYEVGNFARYVYDMMGQQSDGSWIELQKTSLHAWHVPEEINRVRWTFFADLFNAGSTGVAEDILYINPSIVFFTSRITRIGGTRSNSQTCPLDGRSPRDCLNRTDDGMPAMCNTSWTVRFSPLMR